MTRISQRYTVLLFFTLFFLTAIFNGCSKKNKNKNIKIGVSLANIKGVEFYQIIKSGMDDAGKKLNENIEILYMDAKMYVEKQEEQIKYLLNEGVDAVIVIPVDTGNTSTITKIVTDSNIPLIYLNRFPEEFMDKNFSNDVYYIGSQEKTAGIIQMEYLAEQLNGKGNIAILMGEFGNFATFERTKGVEEVVDIYPDINIVDKKVAKYLEPLASSMVEEWLSSGLEIDAIVANNDKMAIGAIRALEKHNQISDIKVLGIDLIGEAIPELEIGTLKATVFQDAYTQGKTAIETAYNLATGKNERNEKWIPFKLVTPDNYKKFLKN